MSTCGQRRGFLSLFTCGEPAETACTRCGKMVCHKHLRQELSGPCCPDCAVIGVIEPDNFLDSSCRSRIRSSDGTTYGDSDYRSFDPVAGGGGEMGGGGASGEWEEGDGSGASDFQDS
jgi:uncharacterized membrane protein YgcG